ncbi:hypothetical protein IWW55_001289 [Coemansia sp. RSA 2706]|nr:hypothetical protein IWW55_001289 [Coemansia sp. RSA 2706]
MLLSRSLVLGRSGVFAMRAAPRPHSAFSGARAQMLELSRTQRRSLSTLFLRGPGAKQQKTLRLWPRGQQTRGARWEQHTKADYGSRRGNTYRNAPQREQMTPESLVYLIIAINGVVFILWQTAVSRKESLGDASLVATMVKHFSAMWPNLAEGRVWTLVTPAFSHVESMHLLLNMFMLYSFGTDIARLLGKRRFLLFYLGAACCGNLISAVTRGVVLPRTRGDYSGVMQPAVGASTSVVGITTLFACLYPTARLYLFMVVPVPAWLATVGFIGWDLWRVMGSTQSRVDGAGHLGGAAAALGYYWFRLRPLIRRMR